MNKLLKFVAPFFLFASFAEAQLNAPIDIVAEEMLLDQPGKKAIFQKSVEVIHGNMRVTSEKLEVLYLKPQNQNEEAGIDKILAKGHVRVVHGEDEATGDELMYLPSQGKVTLSGNVLMRRAGTVLKGQNLVYDVSTGHVNLNSGSKKQRIKATFTPKQN